MPRLTPSRIVGLGVLHLTLGLVAAIAWFATGNVAWVTVYFRYAGTLFLIGCATVETWFCAEALAEFAPGDPMRPAWLLLMFAGLFRLLSSLVAHVIAKDTYLNPWFVLWPSWDPQVAATVERVGLGLFGPIGFALLGVALALVLRLYRKMGLMSRLTRLDLGLLALVGAYLSRQFYEFATYVSEATTPLSAVWYSNWLTDPLLGLLLVIAILIHRASRSLNRGLIERCWSCYVAGIFLTTVANIGAWAFTNNYLHWPYSAATWYLWFAPAAAFAMGPAYQVAAVRQAKAGGAIRA